MENVLLRPAVESDLEAFFQFQEVPEANEMAAFTAENPSDKATYIGNWTGRLRSPSIKLRTILCGGQIAGSVASFEMAGKREVTYWLGKEFWGQGIATQALTVFLTEEQARPLYGRVAKHNLGSSRVLEKCGFQRIGEEKGFSEFLQREVEEWVFELTFAAD